MPDDQQSIAKEMDELPLTESTYLILLSLWARPRHGYAIMKDVEDLSDGRVSLATGTLYGALKRLLDQGLIERAPDPQPDDTERSRQSYRLTERGRRVVRAETARMSGLVTAAGLRLAKDAGSAR